MLDHLALMIELLGDFPRHLALGGKYSSEYFTRRGTPAAPSPGSGVASALTLSRLRVRVLVTRAGELRNIHKLKHWGLRSVLLDKYKMGRDDAAGLVDFLLPMLDYNVKRRITAQQALKSAWLAGV